MPMNNKGKYFIITNVSKFELYQRCLFISCFSSNYTRHYMFIDKKSKFWLNSNTHLGNYDEVKDICRYK